MVLLLYTLPRVQSPPWQVTKCEHMKQPKKKQAGDVRACTVQLGALYLQPVDRCLVREEGSLISHCQNHSVAFFRMQKVVERCMSSGKNSVVCRCMRPHQARGSLFFPDALDFPAEVSWYIVYLCQSRISTLLDHQKNLVLCFFLYLEVTCGGFLTVQVR